MLTKLQRSLQLTNFSLLWRKHGFWKAVKGTKWSSGSFRRLSESQPCVNNMDNNWLTCKLPLPSNEERAAQGALAVPGLAPVRSGRCRGLESGAGRAPTSLRPSGLFPHHFTSRASHLKISSFSNILPPSAFAQKVVCIQRETSIFLQHLRPIHIPF